ncbi:uncharacterized protein LOC114363156 [Ostrinia furnacalis]|uniref:uncharacterized protein LOC114363156 n=1 Tax=Ostrinia furnacalis TaxID=93504 RepID=UPI00103D2461|nr:uncharacterized protein LOC114363156 [Ostrinia furnacalis]
MSFLNQVVLVTGAGSGLGEAIALHFAKLSARLSLVDVDSKSLNKSADNCEKVSKAKVFRITADLTKLEDVQNVVEITKKQYGKIDVVVNCAGICRSGGILDSGLMDSYDAIVSINLRAIVAMTSTVAPILAESKGNIVNISSVLGNIHAGNTLMYNTVKAGLSYFTKSAALELAPEGVRVNAVLPGSTRTNLLKNFGRSQAESDAFFKYCEKITPLKRIVTPEEVASTVAFLASEKAAGITGVNYVMDAGLSLRAEKP